jgi:phosphoribosylformylglycinamidine cyclo-ligase
MARKARRPEVLASIGGFAALSRLPRKYKRPLLVVSTDGVGTKVILAKEMNRLNTVGIDLVAMSVNDILTVGAEPLLFLDYYATGKLNVRSGADVVKGVVDGCRISNCALVGGETAEMPQVYRGGDFDLAGFCVGVVEEGKVIDGEKVRRGDALVGLPSSGVHSNGFSLVRAILRRARLSLSSRPSILKGKTLGEALLAPTKIYVREVLKFQEKGDVHAMAHITGGGLEGNVPRAFPKGLEASIDFGSWKVPPLFQLLQEKGNVSEAEMYRTFNMGIGYVLVVDSKDVQFTLGHFTGAKVIGSVI